MSVASFTQPRKGAEFLHKAHQLLATAITYRNQQRYDLALEYAYQRSKLVIPEYH